MNKTRRLGMIALVLSLSGVAAQVLAPASGEAHLSQIRARLADANGKEMGQVVFWPALGGKVLVQVSVNRVTAGFHGIHIHANDQGLGCVAPAFTSVGSHWVMPSDGTHGDHTGDFPNVLVAEDGTGQLWFMTDHFDLSELAGHAVIFHANADNHGNVPVDVTATTYTANSPDAVTLTRGTGNAGARVGCGVIEGR
jgi:Cu-Zn family superoxide dismutase